MRFLIAFLALLLFLALLGAQEKLVLKGDVKEVEVERTVIVKDRVKVATLPVTITAPNGATDYRWKYPANVTAADDDSETLEITDAPNGTLTVSVRMKSYAIVDGKIVVTAKTLQITFTVGEVIPPKPIDPPKPADPPSPIQLPGLRVLIITETNAGPPSLNLIISGEKVRSYMNEKGVKGGFLALDKDLTVEQLIAAGQEQWVVDAFKRWPGKQHPWIIIGNGKTGFEGALPLTNAPTDALNLIKKYGG